MCTLSVGNMHVAFTKDSNLSYSKHDGCVLVMAEELLSLLMYADRSMKVEFTGPGISGSVMLLTGILCNFSLHLEIP